MEGEEFHSREVLGMKDDLWARVRGLGSITWKGCDWVELLVVRTRRTGSGMIFLIFCFLTVCLILWVFVALLILIVCTCSARMESSRLHWLFVPFRYSPQWKPLRALAWR